MLVAFLKEREFMKNSIFKLEEHTSRLFYSAKRMGMTIPYTEKEINDACNKIISVQSVENGYVRPTVWRGSEMMANFRTTNKNSCCHSNLGMGILL